MLAQQPPSASLPSTPSAEQQAAMSMLEFSEHGRAEGTSLVESVSGRKEYSGQKRKRKLKFDKDTQIAHDVYEGWITEEVAAVRF